MKSKKKIIILLLVIVLIAAAAIGGVFIYKSFSDKDNDNDNGSSDDTPVEIVYDDPQQLAVIESQNAEIDPDADYDGDGLINSDEEKYGTNIYSSDTDLDGISDYAEIFTTKTDPLVYDTDGDSLGDGVELAAGLNPLVQKTDGETLDSLVVKENTINYDDNCTFEISGSADIYDAYFETADITGMANTPGVISSVYEFYSDNDFKSANINISYDPYYLSQKGIDVNSLGIYTFEADGTFKRLISSTIDEETYSVYATVTRSGKYVLCDAESINTKSTPQVMLLIDNSGSMYPEELCDGSDENDVDFKRVDMAEKLIEMCDDTISFGLAKFTGTYTQLADLGSSDDELNEQLEGIRTVDETFDGTYIANSLKAALNNFEADDKKHRNFIVMLTDGYTTEGGLFDFSFYNENNAIEDANSKNVSIIIIGLGSTIDTEYLTRIANNTGGRFIYASNADALDEVYDIIIKAINYDFSDGNGDGINDDFLIADSGFKANVNGYPFINYIVEFSNGYISEGQCFGLAEMAQLYYTGNLPLSMEAASYSSKSLIKTTLSADGYDLSGIDFFANGKGNLFNYTNPTLTAYKNLKDLPLSERYTLTSDGKLEFTEKALNLIKGYPLIKVGTKTSKKGHDYPEGGTYYSYEYVYFALKDINKEDLSSDDLEAYAFLSAVCRIFIEQFSDDCYNEQFSFPSSELSGNAQIRDFNTIIETLNSGVPYIVSSNAHAVNGIRLYRNIDNPNEYTFVLYDNNDSGKEKYLKIVKTKTHFWDFDATHYANDYVYTVYDISGTFVDNSDKKISLDLYDAN